MTEKTVVCPHHNSRGPRKPMMITLHADASPDERGTIAWLMNPASKVSYHILIGRTGTVYRCVPDSRRAWSNGTSRWEKITDTNAVSLNLAWANKNDAKEPLTEAQIVAAQQVIAAWRKAFGMLPVTTHALIATPRGRKTDPNAPNFRLADFETRAE